ncbi:MAG: hypothetical protein QXG63_05190 [Nitrososphaerales archaeon]
MRNLKITSIAILLSVLVTISASLLIVTPIFAPQQLYLNIMPAMCQAVNGMMGNYRSGSTPLTHNTAAAIAKSYLNTLNNPDLAIGEFEEYSNNFYLSIIEKSSGRGAFELIIDRYSGRIHPEPQSMMWNAKYGMMHRSSAASAITEEQAIKIAQEFLKVNYPATEVGEVVAYYGYYTIMVTLNGEHYGMLSVNGYSGAVWYHSWHGTFISEVETH